MRAHLSLPLAALALLPLGLACSSTTARLDDGTVTTARDTSTVQNPPGYQGMPRDTATTPTSAKTPVDTLLQRQGTGATHDTSDYTRIERDTIPPPAGPQDSTGITAADSASAGAVPRDTTGYDRAQPPDSTSR
ncbi:MAG: hypothetical protein ACJ8DC_15965 [Gemmatimonadales bacterium]